MRGSGANPPTPTSIPSPTLTARRCRLPAIAACPPARRRRRRHSGHSGRAVVRRVCLVCKLAALCGTARLFPILRFACPLHEPSCVPGRLPCRAGTSSRCRATSWWARCRQSSASSGCWSGCASSVSMPLLNPPVIGLYWLWRLQRPSGWSSCRHHFAQLGSRPACKRGLSPAQLRAFWLNLLVHLPACLSSWPIPACQPAFSAALQHRRQPKLCSTTSPPSPFPHGQHIRAPPSPPPSPSQKTKKNKKNSPAPVQTTN